MYEDVSYSIAIQLRRKEIVFGPRLLELLTSIQKTGSLTKAAKLMNMSYNKAWRIIAESEKNLGFSLIESNTGGLNGGGSSLTKEGLELKTKYLIFQREVQILTSQTFEKIFK